MNSNKRQIRPAQYGFTIVELVIVIVTISILAYSAFSLFLRGDSFNTIAVRDLTISMIRSAHQNSLGRASASVSITPSAGGDSLTIETSDSGGTLNTATVDLDSVSLSGDINKSHPVPSCSADDGDTAITNAAPMVINFANLGDLDTSGIGGGAAAIDTVIRICVNNQADASICVSRSGYAYAGDCDA